MGKGVSQDRRRCWTLYVLRCGDGTYYTGITTDLARRLSSHNAGKGGRYTRSHLPVTLLFHKKGLTRSGALRAEIRFKRLSRQEKEKQWTSLS